MLTPHRDARAAVPWGDRQGCWLPGPLSHASACHDRVNGGGQVVCVAQAWGVCAGPGALGASTASLWGPGFSAEHVLRASLLWTLAACPLVPMPPVAVPAPLSFLLPGPHVRIADFLKGFFFLPLAAQHVRIRGLLFHREVVRVTCRCRFYLSPGSTPRGVRSAGACPAEPACISGFYTLQ